MSLLIAVEEFFSFVWVVSDPGANQTSISSGSRSALLSWAAAAFLSIWFSAVFLVAILL